MIIDMILETDMAKHFESLGKFHSRALSIQSNFSMENIEDKLLIMNTAVKCADIGNCAKKWDLYYT